MGVRSTRRSTSIEASSGMLTGGVEETHVGCSVISRRGAYTAPAWGRGRGHPSLTKDGGRGAIFFSYDIFVHGSKFQFIDGINLNLTHVCVCCEIIFVFTYIALVVFVYKVKQI